MPINRNPLTTIFTSEPMGTGILVRNVEPDETFAVKQNHLGATVAFNFLLRTSTGQNLLAGRSQVAQQFDLDREVPDRAVGPCQILLDIPGAGNFDGMVELELVG